MKWIFSKAKQLESGVKSAIGLFEMSTTRRFGILGRNSIESISLLGIEREVNEKEKKGSSIRKAEIFVFLFKGL